VKTIFVGFPKLKPHAASITRSSLQRHGFGRSSCSRRGLSVFDKNAGKGAMASPRSLQAEQ
jgi:hypothetical protein